MRLGLLLPPLEGPAAGLAVYVEEVGSRLLALHPDWLVFTEGDGKAPAWCGGHPTVPLGAGAAMRALRRLTHRRLARVAAIQRTLRRELGAGGVDALLVPFHDGVLRSSVPQAIVIHDLTLLRHPPRGSRLARAYMRLLFRRVAAGAERLIAVSAATAGDLRREWGVSAERVRVVHEGFDREIFRPFCADEVRTVLARHGVEPPYLFYAGTLARHKNLAVVLDALARLAPARSDLRLAVAGPRESGGFADFRRRARELGVERRLETLGYVDRRDLGPLMAGAAAFVFPSLAEGFGLAAVEAMASGAAVLAADRASLPEVVGDGGRLLDPHDPGAWADAIAELLDRPRRAHELRRRAMERASAFDWDRAAAEILELLRELAEAPRPGDGRAR